MKPTQLIDFFQRSRASTELAIIEGVQALKHAIRFKAEFEKITTCNVAQLKTYLEELAPDLVEQTLSLVEEVEQSVFNKLSPQPPRTQVIAVAKRKSYKISDLRNGKPLVFLEDPRDLENIGAVIRVSAAAGVAGVVISGQADIWHPGVIRGAAGLHYALPVLNAALEEVAGERQLVSLDPTGTAIKSLVVQKNAILIFGTERHGISKALLEKSDVIARLPMEEGVSSLNLATSVAATLYGLY
jgi:TrmH family RNA methyltransferase